MSGDWIKMRGNLWDDPRVGRICDMTGSKEATVIGALYWLWATADQHTEDGCMPGLSMQQIDRKTGLKGFASALVDIGWLADDPRGIIILHFDEHNGTSAKKRAQTAKRVSSHRSSNAYETHECETCNDVETLDCEDSNASSVTPALAREEKRREEEKPPPTPRGGVSRFPPGFDSFWAAYPRKVGKDAAAKAFAKRRVGAELLAAMLAAIDAQRHGEQWQRNGGQFVPHPATWLNEGRWQDELPAIETDAVFGAAL